MSNPASVAGPSGFESNGSGIDSNVPAQKLRELGRRWKQFLALHAARLKAGRRFRIGEPALKADLFPTFTFNRMGKPDWPPRKG